MKLEGKVAIITGSARGLGKATAVKFVKEGAKVVVCDVNMDQVNETVVEIKEMGGEAIGLKVDVTNRESVQKLIDDTVAAFGKLDIIVNNAGITADSTLLKMKEEDFDKVINVNLKGVFNCAQAAAIYMSAHGGGVILSASSVVGLYGNFGQSNYAATKWAVIGMTKTWAKELAKKGIRVNAVAPGFIESPMTEKMPEEVLEGMRNKSPMKALGKAEDIADAYCFLASDEAKYITGTVLSVDGGVVL